MSPRFLTSAALACVATLASASNLSGQDTTTARPGVRLGLSYPAGTTPRVIVLPIDTTAGDSLRTIIERDLDYGNRIAPIRLELSTLLGLAPPLGQEPNYPLFAQFGAAAIVQGRRTAGGVAVTLYDVAAKRRVESREFSLGSIRAPRDGSIRDSIQQSTTRRERALRDSVQRALEARAELMRRAPVGAERDRRTATLDSLRRDSAATAYVRRGMTRWEQDRRDSVALAAGTATQRLIREDSAAVAASLSGQRMSIHAISDEVERWITGRRGIAASRITYVHNGMIRVVDSDGANDHVVVRGAGVALSPAWSPTARTIVYSRMLVSGTQIEQVDLVNGRIRQMTRGGLNITPVYSLDGRSIVYSHGQESGTDLMMISADGEGVSPQRLTFGRGSDNTSPTFSPDGRRIGFVSGRSGNPQLYVMDADGANVQVLTPFSSGVRSYRNAPDWSPDGRAVAYEQQMGDFQVWMMSLRDRQFRRLTSEGENEGPSWAPDGRHLAISSTRSGSKQIWILDTESGRFRQLTRSPGARLAAWSPMLVPSP